MAYLPNLAVLLVLLHLIFEGYRNPSPVSCHPER
jgi:hypothetical protein